MAKLTISQLSKCVCEICLEATIYRDLMNLLSPMASIVLTNWRCFLDPRLLLSIWLLAWHGTRRDEMFIAKVINWMQDSSIALGAKAESVAGSVQYHFIFIEPRFSKNFRKWAHIAKSKDSQHWFRKKSWRSEGNRIRWGVNACWRRDRKFGPSKHNLASAKNPALRCHHCDTNAWQRKILPFAIRN